MEYFIIAGIIIIGLLFKSSYDKKRNAEKLRRSLKKQWGDVPTATYSEEKLKSIPFYYKTIREPKYDVDDITWNDLDMDQIFMTLNNTTSSVGEEYLYAMLRKPTKKAKELERRKHLIHFFESREEDRVKLQELFSNMGKTKSISVFEYMNRLNDIEQEGNTGHILKIVLLVSAIASIFYNPSLGVMATIVVLCVNIVTYFKRKNAIEPYYAMISYLIRWLDTAKEIGKLSIPELKEYIHTLGNAAKTFRSIRTGASVVAPKTSSGDLIQMLVDYVRMMLHLDLIKFNMMILVFQKKKEELNEMFSVVGQLDSAIAIASFRTLMVETCEPVLEEGTSPFIEIKEIYHPMLNEPVKNSIKENKSVLITGSNASGKSTFIKTLAINAILAQTIFTVTAEEYHASYFRIISSMALQDNLKGGESYYIVEIKSLKRILDSIQEEIPTLCFVDEVLRGTNTLERIAASSQILHSLAVQNCLAFAATHDIELTTILKNFYSNYHFQEQVVENQVLFDYKLYEGRAVSKNAIKLLRMMGYSEKIIDHAMALAVDFLEQGEWVIIPPDLEDGSKEK